MVITYYSGYFPTAFLFLPHHDKWKCAALIFPILQMAEPVRAYFYCSIIVNGINFHAAFYKFSSDSIVLGEHLFKSFTRFCVVNQAVFVMIKLKISRKSRL